MAEKKKIRYSEPVGYFPKEIRDKYFGDKSKKTDSGKKTTTKKSK